MAWIKSNQKHLTAFCKICSSETTVNFAEHWLFFSLNRQLLLSAKEQVIWLMIIFISLKGSFPTIGVKSLSRFLRAGFLNSILTSHPVSGGGSLPPSISSGRYSSIFPHIDFSLHPLNHLSTALRETKLILFTQGDQMFFPIKSQTEKKWKREVTLQGVAISLNQCRGESVRESSQPKYCKRKTGIL